MAHEFERQETEFEGCESVWRWQETESEGSVSASGRWQETESEGSVPASGRWQETEF